MTSGWAAFGNPAGSKAWLESFCSDCRLLCEAVWLVGVGEGLLSLLETLSVAAVDADWFPEVDNPAVVVSERALLDISIGPVPNRSHSILMSGNFLLMASTMLRVGLVLPLKMLLSEAGDISIYSANDCWVICLSSMSCLILSFMLYIVCWWGHVPLFGYGLQR